MKKPGKPLGTGHCHAIGSQQVRPQAQTRLLFCVDAGLFNTIHLTCSSGLIILKIRLVSADAQAGAAERASRLQNLADEALLARRLFVDNFVKYATVLAVAV